ncbi:hypothetical protein [Novosphingobium sp.]|uniref:ArnT family glycosyltransferase n=1 Tax=Novosphingobium sp. TaxID=1874826 RepID=UPI0025EE0CD5|nr:hypothetical protein [Novosphingobium sp.]
MTRSFRPDLAVAAFVLACSVLVTQLGGLGREVIDPDESTFILMGADVARGHLPFVTQFDLKPPMIFFLIGGTLAAFGKSIAAVRLLGDALLLGTALITFLLTRRVTSDWAALGGALLYVCFASLELGQPTYSELPALFFGMGGLLALACSPVTLGRAALAGLLMSLAVLSRSNLYPLPLVSGLLLLGVAVRKDPQVKMAAWLTFGLGGLIPVALLIFAYARAGQLAVLKLAMIDVPLVYAQQVGIAEAVLDNLQQLYVITTMQPMIVAPFVAAAATGWTVIGARLLYPASQVERWTLGLITLAALAVVFSLVTSGAVYPHYWLQLLPLLAIACAAALDFAASLRFGRWMAVSLVALPLGSAFVRTMPQALQVATAQYHQAEPFDIATAARHIERSGVTNPTVWAWRKQLIGWYLDSPQLSKAGVQPENIARPAIAGPLAAHGYISKDEVSRLLDMEPDFVVTDAAGIGSSWMRATGRPTDAWLAARYRLDQRFGDVLVYRRINALSQSR